MGKELKIKVSYKPCKKEKPGRYFVDIDGKIFNHPHETSLEQIAEQIFNKTIKNSINKDTELPEIVGSYVCVPSKGKGEKHPIKNSKLLNPESIRYLNKCLLTRYQDHRFEHAGEEDIPCNRINVKFKDHEDSSLISIANSRIEYELFPEEPKNQAIISEVYSERFLKSYIRDNQN